MSMSVVQAPRTSRAEGDPPAVGRTPAQDARRVLIAIPAFNEAGSVGTVIDETRRAVPLVDILVIDDGSTDATVKEARDHGALVLALPFNIGVGGAMRAGFRYAVRSGYDAVIQIDGDGQHEPLYIQRMLEMLTHADVVIGARFAGVGEYKAPRARRIVMALLSWLMTRLIGTHLTDVTSGFRAAGPRALHVYAVHYPAEYLGDTIESLVIAKRTRLRVTQVPVGMRPRTAGSPSQNSVRSAAYLARAVATIALGMIRKWPISIEEVQ